MKHMPDGDDVTLIVLKGHLLIEESLREVVGTVVAHAELLEEARLSFSQLMHLAKAMSWRNHDSDIWDILKIINSLRNDLAHRLEPEKLEVKVRRATDALHVSLAHPEFRHHVDPRFFDALTRMPFPDLLKGLVSYVMGFLEDYAHDALEHRQAVDEVYRRFTGSGLIADKE